MERCIICGNNHLQQKSVKLKRRVNEKTYQFIVPAFVCPTCKEEYYDMEVLENQEDEIEQGLHRPMKRQDED